MNLDDLLVRWRNAASSGEILSPELMCRNHPELLEDFKLALAYFNQGKYSTTTGHSRNAFIDTPQRVEKPPRREVGSPHYFFSPSDEPSDLGVLGSYRILRELGRGGMGYVFLAEDRLLRRKIALKVMKPEIVSDEHARARFQREAQAAAQLHSDHITPIFAIGEENGILFIAMPLLPGESLEQFLKGHESEKVPHAVTFQIAVDVANGLAVAHSSGVLHRDIKPANLWLEDHPSQGGHRRTKILDFGLARTADNTGLTLSGQMLGTPGYMSPEQINGEEVDCRTDLFSLGCVLYRLATGRNPFPGKSAHAILLATNEIEPPAPSVIRTSLPKSACDKIQMLLRKHPDGRFKTAADVVIAFQQELDSILECRLAESVKIAPTEALETQVAEQTEKVSVKKSSQLSHHREFQELVSRLAVAQTEMELNGIISEIDDLLHAIPDPDLVFFKNNAVNAIIQLRRRNLAANSPAGSPVAISSQKKTDLRFDVMMYFLVVITIVSIAGWAFSLLWRG